MNVYFSILIKLLMIISSIHIFVTYIQNFVQSTLLFRYILVIYRDLE